MHYGVLVEQQILWISRARQKVSNTLLGDAAIGDDVIEVRHQYRLGENREIYVGAGFNI